MNEMFEVNFCFGWVVRLGTKVTLTFSFFLFLTGVFVLKVAARAPKVLQTGPLITEVKQH